MPRLIVIVIPVDIQNRVVVKRDEKMRDWMAHLYVNDGPVPERDDELVLVLRPSWARHICLG